MHVGRSERKRPGLGRRIGLFAGWDGTELWWTSGVVKQALVLCVCARIGGGVDAKQGGMQHKRERK
eukprot:6042605-Prorocentrum_lima.AAC.1